MSDDARLSLSVEHADGSLTRWGPDEVDSGRIPSDLSFTNSTPGGFGSLTCSLLRDLTQQADENLFDTVRAYGPGGQVAWEGRMSALPRGDHALNPTAAGWSAHLEDDQSFMEVYVDSDASAWGEPTLARKIVQAVAGEDMGKISASAGNGGLSWAVPAEALAAKVSTELQYAAPPGVTISSVQYVGTQSPGGSFTNFEAPIVYGASVPDLTSSLISTPALTFDGTLRGATLAADRRYLMMRAYVNTAVTPGAPWVRGVSRIAVYSNVIPTHSPGGGMPDGVYASDVIAHAVSTAAPELNYSTGATGTIQPTTFVIPQMAFKEPTTAAEVISRANAYHGWDWMVWEGRTFYFVPAASGVQWQARQSDGASLQLEGDAADQVINGVVVAYSDNGPDEVRRSGRVRDGHRIQRPSGHVERQSVQRALSVTEALARVADERSDDGRRRGRGRRPVPPGAQHRGPSRQHQCHRFDPSPDGGPGPGVADPRGRHDHRV
jgi:hypothetical protein